MTVRVSPCVLDGGLLLAALIFFAVFSAGCGSDDSGSNHSGGLDEVLALLPLHAEPDAVNGGRIVDSAGRDILLRGVNVNALAEYWQGTPFPTTFPFGEADADMMAAIGWNTVRLLLSWSRVEPAPGMYDAAYLGEVQAAVEILERRGIYTIIDLHQDAWGATLAAPAEQECPAGSEPAFGWDGAPAWATFDSDRPRCMPSGVRELTPAVVGAFRSFWEDREGPGGVGIRTRYVRMLGHVAGVFARSSAVAGYDIMNEPNAFRPQDMTALGVLHSEALQAIREAERAAGGHRHLVFFEPSGLWSSFGMGAPPDFERDDDVVYAPHIYTGGFDGLPITAAAFEVAVSEAAGFGGVPILSGEWGADPRRASDPGDPYFVDHQDLQDQFLIGATLWTWRESCGDPHKAADFRAGRTPYVWGEFDVDCETNAVSGMRIDLVAQLTRAFVRAAAGRLTAASYDFATGHFTASGSDPTGGTTLVVFYPSGRHGLPAPQTSGLSAVETLPAAGGHSYVVARGLGGDWSMSLR
jgi:endoglycosylceramidase